MSDDIQKLPTIVMVDPDQTARSQNAGYLRSWGFDVIEAESSTQCLSIISGRRDIDVLFSRVALEALNGFELALQVRKDRPLIKVVLATNDGMAAHKTRLLCDQYLWTQRL